MNAGPASVLPIPIRPKVPIAIPKRRITANATARMDSGIFVNTGCEPVYFVPYVTA